MARTCPDCGHKNDDGRLFCSSCGNPLDAELRLIKDLEKNKHRMAEQPKSYLKQDDDEDDYVAPVSGQEEEKKSPLPLILLGVLAVVLVVAAVLLL